MKSTLNRFQEFRYNKRLIFRQSTLRTQISDETRLRPKFGRKMRILKQSRRAKKIKRGEDPLNFLKLHFVAKH